MLKFNTFEEVDGMDLCEKNVAVEAKQIHCKFRVVSLEGDYAQGKNGDYLMRGIKGELYICDKEIFEKSYNFI